MDEKLEHWKFKKHQVSQALAKLNTEKLKRLDYGDTALVDGKFDEVCGLLREIVVIGDAGCSQLVELVDTLRERDGIPGLTATEGEDEAGSTH